MQDDGKKVKKGSFLDRIKAARESVEVHSDIAAGNLTGSNSARARTVQGAKGPYTDLEKDNLVDVFADRKDWEQIGADNQDAWDITKATAGGFFGQAAAGFLSAVASNDMRGLVNTATGQTETKYGNALSDFAKSMAEATNNKFHIFKNNENGNSIFTGENFARHIQNFGYTAGIVVETIGEQALLAYLSGGVGNVAKAAKFAAKPGVFGTFSGVKEAYMNALETQGKAYQKFRNAGYNERESQEKANQAATLGFRAEALPLMALNTLQVAALRRADPFKKGGPGTGYSDAFQNVADRMLPNVKSKYGKKAIDYGLSMTSEAIEEGIQAGIGNYAVYATAIKEKNDKLQKQMDMKDVLFNSETSESMVGGAFGGFLFRLLGKRIGKLQGNKEDEHVGKQYDQFLSGFGDRISTSMKDLKGAISDGDRDRESKIRRRIQKDNVYAALSFDRMRGTENGFSDYIDSMSELLDAARSKKTEDLKAVGLNSPQDIELIRNNFPKYIDDANSIKAKVQSNFAKSNDFDIALTMTNQQQFAEENAADALELENAVKVDIGEDSLYKDYTPPQKDLFNNLVEQKALTELGAVGLDQSNKDRLDTLETLIAESGVTDTERGSVNKHSGLIGHKYAQNMMLSKNHAQLSRMASNAYMDLHDPTKQKELKKERALRTLERAKSLADIEKAETALKSDGAISTELENKVRDKKVTAVVRDTVQPVSVEGPNAQIEEQVVDANSNITSDTADNDFEPNIVIDEEVEQAPDKKAAISPVRQDISSTIEQQTQPAEAAFDDGYDDSDAYFQPTKIEMFSDDVLANTSKQVKAFYESMEADLGRKPTFKELVKDFVKQADKELADRLFYVLSDGWTRNGYEQTNFHAAYNDIFRDRRAIARDLVNLATEKVTGPVNEEELDVANQEILDSEVKDKDVSEQLDYHNKPKNKPLKDKNSVRTVVPTLKAAFKSIPSQTVLTPSPEGHVDVETKNTADSDLIKNKYVDSNSLLDSMQNNVGTKLSVGLADNYNDIKIQTWVNSYEKGPSITFGEWAANNVDQHPEGSDKWLDLVPMAAKDPSGKQIFFVHDTDWYNRVNIGLKDDGAAQDAVIEQGQKNVRALRKSAFDGGTNIEITEKRGGSYVKYSKEEGLKTLNQAVPGGSLLLVKDNNLLKLDGSVGLGDKNLVNKYELQKGHVYDVRPGVNKNDIIAFEVLRDKLDDTSVKNVRWALRAFLYQYDSTNKTGLNNKFASVVDGVRLTTGLDLKDKIDFENFLSLYVNVFRKPAKDAADIHSQVEQDDNYGIGESYIALQKGSVVFGIKGQKIGTNNKHDVLFMHPNTVNKKGGAKKVQTFLSNLDKSIGSFVQNTSDKGLSANNIMPIINNNGTVTSGTDYRTHLRDNFKTSVKAFNISDEENPVYATLIQPVVHFKEVVETPRAIKEDVGIPLSQEKELKKDKVVVQEEVMPDAKTDKLLNLLNFYRENGFTEDSQQIQDVRNLLGDKFPESGATQQQETMFQPTVGKDQFADDFYAGLSPVKDMTTRQISETVDFIYNVMSREYDYVYKGETSKDDLISATNVLRMNYSIKHNKLKSLRNSLFSGSIKDDMAPESLLDTIQQYEAVLDNWTKSDGTGLVDLAYKKLLLYTGAKETVEKLTDASTQQDVNYAKTSLEEVGKDSASYRIRRFLAAVKNVDKSGKTVKGHLGIPTFIDFNQAFDTIQDILISPTTVGGSVNDMLNRLKDNVEVYPWLAGVVASIEAVDKGFQNEMLYTFDRHAARYKFMMYKFDTDTNTYKLKVFSSDSTEILQSMLSGWKDMSMDTSLISANEKGQYHLNRKSAKQLLSRFEDWSSQLNKRVVRGEKTVLAPSKMFNKKKYGTETPKISPLQSRKDLRQELTSWLQEFGISLSQKAMTEMMRSGVTYHTKDGEQTMELNNMFAKTDMTAGIFGQLGYYLSKIDYSSKEPIEVQENIKNHPHSEMNNILKNTAKLNSKFTKVSTTKTFRDNGKMISGIIARNHATDTAEKLIKDSVFRENLLNCDYSKDSYLLKLLNDNAGFRDTQFELQYVGESAMKEDGSKSVGADNSIAALSAADHEWVKLGMFQDMEQGSAPTVAGIDTRMATMFVPTMSDKSQMCLLKTAVLDLRDKYFNFEGKEIVGIKDSLKDILFSQLVEPDLKRIDRSIKRGPSGIKGFDIASKLFLSLPKINNVVDKSTGERAIAMMQISPEKYDAKWFRENFRSEVDDIILEVIQSKVKEKKAVWSNSGFFKSKEVEGEETKYNTLDTAYKERLSGTNKQRNNVAVYDFVINNMLTTQQAYSLFTGDLACYATGKMYKYFDGKTYLPNKEFGDNAYALAVKEGLSVNTGKRLALMLAPGAKLANSKGEKYAQVFLEDIVDMSENVLMLVKLNESEELYKKVKSLHTKYVAESDPATKKEILKAMKDSSKNSKDFFEIELTDAQEYTTLREHMRVLYGQGRVSKDVHDTVVSAYEKGEDIPREVLQTILQLLKPVHTGFKYEPDLHMMRQMYIKSSSFPLIPQLTKGLEIDKLRVKLEEHEKALTKSTGGKVKYVRASYQTANKVGANTKTFTPFNTDGTFSDIDTVDLNGSTTILDRDNFRIQLDVPYKSSKKSADTVSLATQAMKLLFGDGITEIKQKIFDFNGVKHSGSELRDIFNKTFVDYVQHQKEILLDDLGVDESGKYTDIEKAMPKLQAMLKDEAIGRGYPQQDIDALELIPVMSSDGSTVIDIDFTIPIWLSPNSNRYEALLNAIVSSRLSKIKLPGHAYVLASEAGMKVQSDLRGIDQSKIVFTKDNVKSLKGFKSGKGGNLNQIFLPAKFRLNDGTMIDLIDSSGNYNQTYVERLENGTLKLIDGMIDRELLSIPSFRIPTSSHVSMSQMEIVGFLPKESGDMLIVPKNLIPQKGLDFDVDKETTYHLHTYVDSKGAVKPISVDALDDIKLSLGDEFNNDKIQAKIYENDIVRIHSTVLGNTSLKVQGKINKILSMDFERSVAASVQAIADSQSDIGNFTMLSDEFQKYKMGLGSAGKLGIGVYSNYVVLHSQVQQNDANIGLSIKSATGFETDFKVVIGDQTSDGTLGNSQTLAPNSLKRFVSEVFAARQNTGTDNEKEQIMGRLNVNELTINADALMTALGFDKAKSSDGTVISIPYYLLSQPIIKKYVDLMRRKTSNIADYTATAQEDTIAQLKTEYSIKGKFKLERVAHKLTADELKRNLQGAVNNETQLAVLETFLSLDRAATKLSKAQSDMSVGTLGKSFFETIENYRAAKILDKYSTDDGIRIKNIEKLVGEYTTESQDGSIKVSEKKYIKPTTPTGAMLINTAVVGYNTWNKFFPYEANGVAGTITSISNSVLSDDAAKTRKADVKAKIFKSMKQYFYSSNKTGMFHGNPTEARRKLFFETVGDVPLGAYLRDLTFSDNESYKKIVENKLLSSLKYKTGDPIKPYLIQFDGTKAENFDEQYLYEAIVELMVENRQLPDKAGEPYSTRDLAHDLLSYAYLEGGIQEAGQFVKYIPVQVLQKFGFASMTRNWNDRRNPYIFTKMLQYNSDTANRDSRFKDQYLRHNIQGLPKLKEDMYSEANYVVPGDKSTLQSFQLDYSSLTEKQMDSYVDYVVVGKDMLFKMDLDGTFKRVSNLGTYGMVEYNMYSDLYGKGGKSIIHTNYYNTFTPNTVKPVIPEYKPESASHLKNFGVGELDSHEVLKNISTDETVPKPTRSIAQVLSGYDVPRFQVVDFLERFGVIDKNGAYVPQDNEIFLDKSKVSLHNASILGGTIVHESVHSTISPYISRFTNKDGTFKTGIAIPTVIRELMEVYKVAKRSYTGASVSDKVFDYAFSDIHEFVSYSLTDKGFQDLLDTMPYKKAGINIFERISKMITDILKAALGLNYSDNTIAANAVELSIRAMDEYMFVKAHEKASYSAMEENDSKVKALLDIVETSSDIGLPKADSLEQSLQKDEEALLEESMIFEDPFNCV